MPRIAEPSLDLLAGEPKLIPLAFSEHPSVSAQARLAGMPDRLFNPIPGPAAEKGETIWLRGNLDSLACIHTYGAGCRIVLADPDGSIRSDVRLDLLRRG